jgi:signal transduction histidine kinase
MSTTVPVPSPAPSGFSRVFGWRRLLVTLVVASLLGLCFSPAFSTTPVPVLMLREMSVGLLALLAFGIFEQSPRKLPSWLPRWVLQVLSVEIAIPLGAFILYTIITSGDPTPWRQNVLRVNGFLVITVTGVLVAPWVAVAAIFRQRDAAERRLSLAFELERSELERKALDSRLRLLQAQVEPHFLFNTLANVRELVDSGSPDASKVLDSLIAYLRAAVPRLHETSTTMGQEVQLVRAYLELMHMRMPDRLQFELMVDDAALELRCPPTTLLTLVENAIRHGIDPSEEGGRIEVRVEVRDGRCRAQVRDTGVGLRQGGDSLGTGLATLRERLELVFGGDAHLRISSIMPRGVVAEVDFPARRGAA